LLSLLNPGTIFVDIIENGMKESLIHAVSIEIISTLAQLYNSILYFPVYLLYLVIMVTWYKGQIIINEGKEWKIMRILDYIINPILVVIVSSINWILEQRELFSRNLGKSYKNN